MKHNKVLGFNGFLKIFEGGSTIKDSIGIKQYQFKKTFNSIKELAFPLLGIESDEYLIIGSIGKKKDESEESGDLDIGYDANSFMKRERIGYKECSERCAKILGENLGKSLGFQPDIKLISALNITSVGWPIEGDLNNGIVQVDFIPLSDMEWAKFIYYSPDYRKDESKYKSVHRNSLFSAILAERSIVKETDPNGDWLDYEKPVIILNDGLYWHTKSFRGAIKSRLARSQKVPGSEVLITRDPDEFVKFTMGSKYKPKDVKTFEEVFSIINSPKFDLHNKLPKIIDRYVKELKRKKLEIPKEIYEIKSF